MLVVLHGQTISHRCGKPEEACLRGRRNTSWTCHCVPAPCCGTGRGGWDHISVQRLDHCKPCSERNRCGPKNTLETHSFSV